jgi:hypothetical protein
LFKETFGVRYLCSVKVVESGGTGRDSVMPSGQRTCSAAMGEALLTTSFAEFCDQ